ncbi:hypothetical protein Pcac1_g25595 [Phytophthora cactorum]|nr:hypothetical protein Pcac1_g25595 [Phytophthora cactorum]
MPSALSSTTTYGAAFPKTGYTTAAESETISGGQWRTIGLDNRQ